MRLFFALWPPRETAEALAAWAQEVAASSGGRVTAVENIHLTLAFLGEADAQAAIHAARGANALRHELPIETAKYVRRNEMVWVAPTALPPALAELVQSLHSCLRLASFRLEERAFSAHVTLIRKARMPQSLPPLPAVEWPVDEFVLMRSRTSSKGSTYEIAGRFPLTTLR